MQGPCARSAIRGRYVPLIALRDEGEMLRAPNGEPLYLRRLLLASMFKIKGKTEVSNVIGENVLYDALIGQQDDVASYC